ncbi:MAG: HAD-IIB family hydrolase [Lachnospiraceae bacterium]|nr:HAD-IIB family hydrolase [Lachnospiraceae bacterium]
MKAVFFDIDGTLWDGKLRIPESTKIGIKKLREAGHLAFINSGRARSNILDDELLGLGFDGIVAACGNYVEYKGEVIFNNCLSPEEVRIIIDTADSCNMPIVLEGPEVHYISPDGFDKDPYVDYLFNKLGDRALLTTQYDGKHDINKFSSDVFPETDYETVKKNIFGFVDPINHDGIVHEFIPKGTSKADGIRLICDRLGIDISDTYAIGDSNNDIDMLSGAGHGICMGGGMEKAVKASEYVTDTLENDGLYKALEHYKLI